MGHLGGVEGGAPKGLPVPGSEKPSKKAGALPVKVPSPDSSAPPSPSLKGRVSAEVPDNVEAVTDPAILQALYNKRYYVPGYELMFRTRYQEHINGVADDSWVNKHNDKINLAMDLAASGKDTSIQSAVALCYLIGIGTDLSEEKFLLVREGKDPETGRERSNWEDLSDDPETNYQYARYLLYFQGADIFDPTLPANPKAITLVNCLEKAAKAKHPRAMELWAKRGPALEEERTRIQNALGKSP